MGSLLDSNSQLKGSCLKKLSNIKMMGYLLPHLASRVGQVESGASITPHHVRSHKENLKQEKFGAG